MVLTFTDMVLVIQKLHYSSSLPFLLFVTPLYSYQNVIFVSVHMQLVCMQASALH